MLCSRCLFPDVFVVLNGKKKELVRLALKGQEKIAEIGASKERIEHLEVSVLLGKLAAVLDTRVERACADRGCHARCSASCSPMSSTKRCQIGVEDLFHSNVDPLVCFHMRQE